MPHVTMHRALAVPELLFLIVNEANSDDDEGPPRVSVLSTLLALALTSRAFLDPALNLIWSAQSSLGHLVQCLPTDLWTVSGDEHLILKEPTRPTTHQDWERFDFYARRVRELISDSDEHHFAGRPSRVISESLFFWLHSSRPGHLLLPNLSTLSWGSSIPSGYYGSVHLLCGQQLSTFHIGGSTPRSTSDVIAQALLHLPQRSPLVRELRIILVENGTAIQPVQPILGDVFASLKRLQILSLQSELPMPFSAFAMLASLPHLTQLKLVSEDGAIMTSVPLKTGRADLTFRALEEMTLTSSPMDSSVDVLSSCQLPRLKYIYINSEIAADPDTIVRVLQLLHERCSHTVLEGIDVHNVDYISAGEQVREAIRFTAATMRRLCDFHRIRLFDLHTDLLIVLDDEVIKQLAMSWPRLEFLHFLSANDHPWHTPTATTLKGLVHLARYCPSLRLLTIDLNASDSDVSLRTKPGGGIRNQTLRRVTFGHSPALGNTAKIAAFLFAIFPNIISINDDDEVPIEESWDQVFNTYEVLQIVTRWKKRTSAQ
ncbi:uncharacterized protein B0H18DRAFT_636211 [Fomitopsis serialis]|uniref:uncharacterized protein n=1 Tax=Fomitopsis serialis TaxID=139415 RepID=UPI00200849BC|nr:uncharacterized protein B0H18DRAFT_636211 [Neoantrodia serialis]KAH9919402.1 hypothetical protein B0H18DRAFT_636211 [Neoantrodia serialis]